MGLRMTDQKNRNNSNWNHTSHDQFVEDYANKSLQDATHDRFTRFYEIANYLLKFEENNTSLDVADIGCGTGTQCIIWAQKGHNIRGIDVNQPLIELARKRSSENELTIQYEVGSATNLPWPDQSVDCCLLPELLEHVDEWN